MNMLSAFRPYLPRAAQMFVPLPTNKTPGSDRQNSPIYCADGACRRSRQCISLSQPPGALHAKTNFVVAARDRGSAAPKRKSVPALPMIDMVGARLNCTCGPDVFLFTSPL